MKRTKLISTLVIAISVVTLGSLVGFGLIGTAKGERVPNVESLYLTPEEMADWRYGGTFPDIGMQRWWYSEEGDGVNYLTQVDLFFLGVAGSVSQAKELTADYMDSLEPGSLSGRAIGDSSWSKLRGTGNEAKLLMIKNNAIIYLSANKTNVFSDALINMRIELEKKYPPLNWEEREIIMGKQEEEITAILAERARVMETEEYKAVWAEYQKALEDDGYQENLSFDMSKIDVDLLEKVAGRLEDKISQGRWTANDKLAFLLNEDGNDARVPGVETLLPTSEEMAGFEFRQFPTGSYGSSEWYYTDAGDKRSRISIDISVFSSPDQARMWVRFYPYSSIMLSPGSLSGTPVGDESWVYVDKFGGALLFVKDNAAVYVTGHVLDRQEFDSSLLEEVAKMLVQKIETRNWSPLEVTTLEYRQRATERGIAPNVDALLLSKAEMPQGSSESIIAPVRVSQYDSLALENVFQQGKRQVWLTGNDQKIEVEIFVAPTNNLAEQFATTSWASSRLSLTKRELLQGGTIGDACWSTGNAEYPYRAAVTFLKENAVVVVSAQMQGDTPVDMGLIDNIAIRIAQKIDSFKK